MPAHSQSLRYTTDGNGDVVDLTAGVACTNAHAHIRAALVGPSEAIPIEAGRLLLGTWQQIVLIDFDDRPRERTVLVNVVC